MERTDQLITLAHIFNDDAESKDIGYIAEGDRFLFQLPPDRIGLFAAPLDARRDPFSLNNSPDRSADTFEVILVLRCQLFQHPDNAIARIRVHMGEGKVF